AERGAFGEARACAHGFINSGRAQRLPINEGRGRWVLAEVLRREGELDAAEEEIHTALSILRTVPPIEYPGALATLAALRLAQGRSREALAVAEEARSRAEAIGACSRFFRDAFLHLTHAECLDATGERAAARIAIEKARAWILAVAEKIGDAGHRK